MNDFSQPISPTQIYDASGQPIVVPKQASQPTQEAASGLTPKFVINVARRWWKYSAVIGIGLATVACAVIIWTTEPVYEAVAWLDIRPKQIFADPLNNNGQYFVETQKELIKSPPVITEAMARTELANLEMFKGIEDRVSWLRGEIGVSTVGRSQLFTIKLQSPDREGVHKVVNAVKDAYLNLQNRQSAQGNTEMLEVLNREKSRQNLEIQQGRSRLKSLSKDTGGHNVLRGSENAAAPNPELMQAMALQQQLSDAQLKLVLEEAQFERLKAIINRQEIRVEPGAVVQAVELSDEVTRLMAQVQGIQGQIAADSNASPKGNTGRSLRKQLEKAEADLKKTRAELTPIIKEQLINDAEEDRKLQLTRAEDEIASLQLEVETLEKTLVERKKEIKNIGETSLEYEFLAQDMQLKIDIRDQISQRIELLKTNQSSLQDVSVLMEAKRPINPKSDSLIRKLVMAAGVVFFIPFGGFVLWEMRSRRVGDVSEFTNAANLPVVGEIAALPMKAKLLPGSSQRFEETLSRFEESIEYLRTSILIERRCSHIQSLVVCSASSREGKSTISAHLASSIARTVSGKVLLVDGDMRRPNLHRLLDLKNENGLVDFLNGRCSCEEAVESTWIEDLDFISAGVLDTPVPVLLASNRLDELMSWAQENYTFVVIDVPPILPVSDGLVIAKASDAALFCGLRDVSTSQGITRACEKLRAAGVNIIGTVFSGVPSRHYGASNSYYYYRVRNDSMNV